MLSEEKKQKKLINANVITRHNAIVISCDEQMRISSFSLFKHFPKSKPILFQIGIRFNVSV